MTSTPTVATPSVLNGPAAAPAAALLTRIAGMALLAGAAAFFAGLLSTSAPDGDGQSAYNAAAAAHPVTYQISGVLLHYGNLLLGVGVLALPALVRARRGALLTGIGAALSALTLVNLAGAIAIDWYNLELGRQLPGEAGAAISDAATGHALYQVAFTPGPFSLIGMLLLFVGLSRARAMGWWSVAGIVLGTACLILLPYENPVLPALGVLPMLAVFAAAGIRLLRVE